MRLPRLVDHYLPLIVPLLIAALVLFAVSLWTRGSSEPAITDPRQGRVTVENGLSKHCDGLTLVYRDWSGGVDAVPGSPECQP